VLAGGHAGDAPDTLLDLSTALIDRSEPLG
jgi:hypothetical protein